MGAIENEGQIKGDNFNGHNFHLLKMKMDEYIYYKDLWKLLEGKSKKQGIVTNKDWEILDRKALGTIHLFLAPLVTYNITKEKMIEDFIKS